MKKPDFLSVDDAMCLTEKENAKLFCDHLNPAQFRFLKLLGFHEVLIDHAEGLYYYDRSGNKIMDLFGGFGAIALGHNHPRILAVRRRFEEEKRHEMAMAFISQYASALARNLSLVAPEGLDIVFLGSTGSEVVEAALKLAEKVQGRARSTTIYAEASFHGKSRGALSVTDSPFYQSSFELLRNNIRVPFGDTQALETLFKSNPEIGILILETVQGGAGIIPAPVEYWQTVRQLCTKYKVIWIADEVQCGMGRTGKFFAFEHAGVAPDIVVTAKALGGGKCAMAAMISRKDLYMTAYGTSDTAMIHGPSTFSGMGEACCTAIETLHVLYDEGLIDNSAAMGALMLDELKRIQAKHSSLIRDVRGQGLMVGIEFHDFSNTVPGLLKGIVSSFDERLKGSLCGFVGSILLRDYKILVAFTEYNRNVIRIEPPLIISRAEVLRFTGALDEILTNGISRMVMNYARNFLKVI
ncbi:MAG TPA: aminotransferase class III-fold pyridoxal phosphate-dependent enzyme [Puia sp.]